MEYFSIYYIQLFLQLTFLSLITNQQILNNPLNILYPELRNPIIFNSLNTSYNIITSGTIFVFDRATSQFKFSFASNDFTYSSPYFICIDESNNYFLYANKNYYQVVLNTAFEIENLDYIKTIDSTVKFCGYIKQYGFGKGNNFLDFRSDIGENEIVIYGKKEKKIYFYYVNKNKGFEGNININDL